MIKMQVRYKSGTWIGQTGMIEDERRVNLRHMPEYFVRWADGSAGWYLATNLQF